MRGTRYGDELARHARGFESLGVVAVLIVEQVDLPDADPRGWQPGEIASARPDGVLGDVPVNGPGGPVVTGPGLAVSVIARRLIRSPVRRRA